MVAQANDAGWRVALVIKNTIHRYCVDGMIRSIGRVDSVRHWDLAGPGLLQEEDGPPLDLVLAASAELEPSHVRDAVRAVCARGPRLLVLVDGPDAFGVPWLATCGAQGFLEWSELEPRTLADAVGDIMADKFYVPANLARRLVLRACQAPAGTPAERAPAVPVARGGATVRRAPTTRVPAAATLTPRELQVLRLVAEGLSNKQVSRQLLISEHGVKRLVGNILAKLNCPNRTLAVVRAMDDGLLAV